MTFSKTTMSASEIATDIENILKNGSRLFSAFRSDRVSNSFSEKLMLAVTSVYECRYCNWMHSELATRFGVPEDEIERLLNGDISGVAEEQIAALNYAIGVSNSYNSSGIGDKINLLSAYDPDTVEDIVQLVNFVGFTNRLGNTFDAFIALFIDKDNNNKGFVVPALVFSTMLPIYASVSLLTKKGKNPFYDLSS